MKKTPSETVFPRVGERIKIILPPWNYYKISGATDVTVFLELAMGMAMRKWSKDGRNDSC